MESETQAQQEKRLSLRLLGPPEASLEGLPVRFGTKKELALLCYLAAEGGTHPRRKLAELLWPESEKRRARADLRAVLYKLRKTLGEDGADDGVAGFFVVDGDLLGPEPRGIGLDLEALEAAISLAREESPPAGGGSSAAAGGRRKLMGHRPCRQRGHNRAYRDA